MQITSYVSIANGTGPQALGWLQIKQSLQRNELILEASYTENRLIVVLGTFLDMQPICLELRGISHRIGAKKIWPIKFPFGFSERFSSTRRFIKWYLMFVE